MTNDRIDENTADVRIPKPEVYIIMDGNTVIKPGMKTYFVDTTISDENHRYKDSDGKVVGGTVCSCNKVCTCNTQKSRSCSCNSNRSSGSCSCYPVH